MFNLLQIMLVLVAVASGVNARATPATGELQASGRELQNTVTSGAFSVAGGAAAGDDGAGGVFLTAGEADDEGAVGGGLTYLVAGGEGSAIIGGAGTAVGFSSSSSS